MPQLVPFYFVNEVTFIFAIIAITVYMLSKCAPLCVLGGCSSEMGFQQSLKL